MSYWNYLIKKYAFTIFLGTFGFILGLDGFLRFDGTLCLLILPWSLIGGLFADHLHNTFNYERYVRTLWNNDFLTLNPSDNKWYTSKSILKCKLSKVPGKRKWRLLPH
jgi:hypothetical protein